MPTDRPNAVLIGRVKDMDGFSADLLEDPLTGNRMLAYTPEDWWHKCHRQERLEATGKRNNTPRNAWPARPPRKE